MDDFEGRTPWSLDRSETMTCIADAGGRHIVHNVRSEFAGKIVDAVNGCKPITSRIDAVERAVGLYHEAEEVEKR